MRTSDPTQTASSASRANGSRPENGASSESDGRQARSAQTRRTIIEAYLELLRGGTGQPHMGQIAELAGVGTRTVYNQFRDVEGLRASVGRQLFREWRAYAVPAIPAGASRSKRLTTFLEARTRFLAAIEPFARVAQRYQSSSPELRRQREQLVRISREQLETVFAPELGRRRGPARTRRLNALHAASSWPAWSTLRDELGLDAREATAVMRQTLEALLAH
jgi:TetR/AcrR family transcriptional regulator, regulator of autoinduction and epiphytic fitness